MKINQVSQKQIDESLFPVVKFNYSGEVIGGNSAAKAVLEHWNCAIHTKASEEFLTEHHGIFSAHVSGPSDIKISVEQCVYRFTVVPFPEAGYVGIYGYQMEMTESVAEQKMIIQ